ncbi:alpha-L-fucosidase [Arcticibacter svalbardensis]|uniref:alpha-L-fucosidase n=1 Tax=Arcticibacter svalbardensis TaxID=1288027 RepID=UPI001F390059|nr:alpha-L-fucosidase [Arcticibacter svalbardensis]
MKKILSCLIVCLLAFSSFAQDAGDEDASMRNAATMRDNKMIEEATSGWWKNSMLTHDKRIEWWREAKFGMFIHWGVYSEAGGEWKGKEVGGYAEHLMRKEQITKKEYLELASKFNPVNFDAEKWVKIAKAAGMRYLIVTAKHHDGFAMYPSDYSDFDIADKTSFKRDPMADLKAACEKYGMKFGFYYSHAFDWENPDAPGNDWEYNNPGGDKNLFGGRDWYDVHPELLPKAQKYVNKKAIPQIQELIKKYHPDILWFDTPQKLPLSENIRILKAIREIDPNVVINGRLVRSNKVSMGDYLNTADRPAEFFPVSGDWEAIPTTNESYGYSKFDDSHKTTSHFIQLVANATSRGGNILMNIGPKGDGAFDQKDQRILDSMAIWTKKYGQSIYQTTASPLPLQSWGVITQKNNLLYLHVFNWPKTGELLVGGMNSKVTKVYNMVDKKKIKTSVSPQGNLILELPKNASDPVDAVLVMKAKQPIKTNDLRYLDVDAATNRLLAFDAKLNGEGFSYGDGKTNKYYVTGWKNTSQFLSWDFVTPKATNFKVVIKFIQEKENSGEFNITVDNLSFRGKASFTGKEGLIIKEIGFAEISAGKHQLKINALEISGIELMKILEIDLIPINSIQ